MLKSSLCCSVRQTTSRNPTKSSTTRILRGRISPLKPPPLEIALVRVFQRLTRIYSHTANSVIAKSRETTNARNLEGRAHQCLRYGSNRNLSRELTRVL